jgi:uncharacterized membrane-anchored protein
MAQEHRGRGFIVGGLIVLAIWLAVTLGRALEIPAFWTPLIAGVALIVIGAVRFTMGGGRIIGGTRGSRP